MGMIALVVTTDGRGECLRRTLRSLRESLQPFPTDRFIVDDSGDLDYATFVDVVARDFQTHSHIRRQGFAATVEDAWTLALRRRRVRYVFHAEDDFTYNEPVDLEAMARVLDQRPDVAQLALKRQPVNDEERAAGGFMQARSADTWDELDGIVGHALNFTTNPSLIPRRAIEVALADPRPMTEPNVTDTLLTDGYCFGYLGTVADPPRVEHIGHGRMPGWRQ